MTPKRHRLDDNQCRIVLRDLKAFGYRSLTFEGVRKTADQIADGSYKKTDVIAIIIAKFIDDAFGEPLTPNRKSKANR